jgi:hypothetical protein
MRPRKLAVGFARVMASSMGCAGAPAPPPKTATSSAGAARKREPQAASSSIDGYGHDGNWAPPESITLGGPDRQQAVFRTAYSPWTMQRYYEIPTKDADGRATTIGVAYEGEGGSPENGGSSPGAASSAPAGGANANNANANGAGAIPTLTPEQQRRLDAMMKQLNAQRPGSFDPSQYPQLTSPNPLPPPR